MDSNIELNGQIDKGSALPYYHQLKMIIRNQIESGHWMPGRKLPSEFELCVQFDVSRTVVRQAIMELKNEGYLSVAKGKGTFIASPKITSGFVQELAGFYEVFQRQGYTVTTEVLRQEIEPADPGIAEILHIEPNAPLVVMSRLRKLHGEPCVYSDNYIPFDFCPELVDADMENRSLYTYLKETCGYEIYRGHRYIGVTLAGEREASLLRCPVGSPLIDVQSVTYQRNGKPLECFHSLHRGDRTRFEINLIRIEDYVRSEKTKSDEGARDEQRE
jgi:GntR family transcriptional regulator